MIHRVLILIGFTITLPHRLAAEGPQKQEKISFDQCVEEARQSDKNAENKLDAMAGKLTGTEVDQTQLLKIIHQAAKNGNVVANKLIACFKIQVPENKSELAEEIQNHRDLARKGNAKSQYHIGMSYYSGRGIKQDKKAGLFWLQKASHQGNADAQYLVGLLSILGKEIPRNVMKGIRFLKESAQQNKPESSYELASIYFKGNIVAKDNVAAFVWATLAIDHYRAESNAQDGLIGKLLFAENSYFAEIKKAQSLAETINRLLTKKQREQARKHIVVWQQKAHKKITKP